MSLDTVLQVRNYLSDEVIATTRNVIAYSYESGINQTNPFSYVVRSNDDVANAVVNAVGGPDGTGPYLPYKIGLSYDGGLVFDVWKVIEKVERGLYVQESGYTIFRGYSVAGEDHATYHGCTLDQMLYARAGLVPIDGADTGLEVSGLAFPWTKGLFQTEPIHEIAYTPVIYPYLKKVLFDSDVVADYLDSALKTILTQVSGLVLAGDFAPLGARGSFVEDSSDGAINLASGVSRSLCIGFYGFEPFLTFQADADASDMYRIPLFEDRNTPITILDDRESLAAKVVIVGGNTDCGLPVGGVITNPVCINTQHKQSALNWDASLCVFACCDSAGNGGVYYWPHDGMAYPIGQAIAARGLAYYAPTNMLYAPTDNGVMMHSANVADQSNWVMVGKLRAKCKKLVLGDDGMHASQLGPAWAGNAWRDAEGNILGYGDGSAIDDNVWTRVAYFGGPGGLTGDAVVTTDYTPAVRMVVEVSGNGSGDGLYMYPALGGDSSGTKRGYQGWSVVTTGSFVSWTYHAHGDELLTVDTNDPCAVTITTHISVSGGTHKVRKPTPYGEGITALSSLPNKYGTAVMTTLGADALYVLGLDGTWRDLNSDTTLLDPSNNPVLVNDVYYYGGPLVIGARTLTVYWFALTDSGVYMSFQSDGGHWQPPDSQSGIINENVLTFAIGAPQTLINRVVNRVYACSSNGFWVSHNSGANFRNEVREKLGLGPLFSALGRLVGQSPFLANDVTSLGPIPAGGSTGTSGRNIPENFPSPYTLGGDLVWVRALDQRCSWTFRLVHTTTTVPYKATVFGAVTELGTDGDVGAATASGQLGQMHVRTLADRSRLQRTSTLSARLTSPYQRLRGLRATHMIALDMDTTPLYSIKASPPMRFMVIKVQVSKTATDLYPMFKVSVGTVLRTQPMTLKEIADGVGFTVNRMQHLRSQRAK